MASERPRLTIDAASAGARCPVHPTHRLALVGEAPGPNTDPAMPLYPDPAGSAAGRLRELIGLSRTQYLRTFARANLLDAYPGPVFPVSRARPGVPGQPGAAPR